MVQVHQDHRDVVPGLLGLFAFPLEPLPGQGLVVGQDIDLPVEGLFPGEKGAGLVQLAGQVGALVAELDLGQCLPYRLLVVEQTALFRSGRAIGQEKGHCVARMQRVEDLLGSLASGVHAEPAVVEQGHAAGIVQNDGHGQGRSLAVQGQQAGEGRSSQADGDEHQGALRRSSKVTSSRYLRRPRALHADPQEAQGAEGHLGGLLVVDHVQHHRDGTGEHRGQEQGGSEAHKWIRFVRYCDSTKSYGTEVSVIT